ncbi:hypothetical protein GCM10023332_02710 [Luteimonas vadosa]|uniref:Uncharacterized protein n=1 Tax=Luteimonas vadosa TaxID=1165507 RepID=A0ABP9DNZ5_9GAMM
MILAAAMATCAIGFAPQPASAADEAKPVTLRLQPRQLQGVEDGKAVVVKGEAGPVPQRFLLEGISYMTPVGVALRPVDAGRQVAMDITKYSWEEPLRRGSTDGDILSYLFRTEGEFQVSVTAKQAGTPYRLLVWVAEETRPAMVPVVVKASEFDGGEEGRSWLRWAIAGAVLVVVAALAAMIARRKST